MTEQQVRQIIRDELQELLATDRYIFSKSVQFLDGRNIQTGRTVGTQIGTATDQKIGFLGKAPVARQSTVSAPSGGATIDSEARAAINTIIDRLKAFGFIA
jgi:hypothetical protein